MTDDNMAHHENHNTPAALVVDCPQTSPTALHECWQAAPQAKVCTRSALRMWRRSASYLWGFQPDGCGLQGVDTIVHGSRFHILHLYAHFKPLIVALDAFDRRRLWCSVLCCDELCCVLLCCAVLCCILSYHVASCYAVLWRVWFGVRCGAVPCRSVLCRAVLFCAVLFCTLLCPIVLCCAVAWCGEALCCAVLCCAVLCCVMLWYVVMFYVVL